MAQPLLFEPISLRDITLKNRVVVAPMHQYSAVEGFATEPTQISTTNTGGGPKAA